MREYKKLTINVSPEMHEELKNLADSQDISITELIKRSVALQKFFWGHRHCEILLRDGDTLKEIVLLQ